MSCFQLYIKKRMEVGHEGILKRQLEEFKKGFMRLLDSSILTLFQPRELMELMAGNENYDWEALKEVNPFPHISIHILIIFLELCLQRILQQGSSSHQSFLGSFWRP